MLIFGADLKVSHLGLHLVRPQVTICVMLARPCKNPDPAHQQFTMNHCCGCSNHVTGPRLSKTTATTAMTAKQQQFATWQEES